MKLIEVTRQFSTEDKCLDYLEQMRWPHGVGCVHCGSMSVSTITRTAGKNKRVRIYQCLEWGRVEGQRAKMGVELSRD